MNVKTHASLFVCLATASILLPFAIGRYVSRSAVAGFAQELFFGAFAILALSAILFLYLVPAHCETCEERMHPGWAKGSEGIDLLYTCGSCGRDHRVPFLGGE